MGGFERGGMYLGYCVCTLAVRGHTEVLTNSCSVLFDWSKSNCALGLNVECVNAIYIFYSCVEGSL